MSAKKKPHSTNINEENDLEDIQNLNEEIQIDFEGRSPLDIDFHGIRQLLQQLFLKAHVNLNDLSNMIIEQNWIGSVIIQSLSEEDDDEDDEDELCDENTIFGVTTVINLSSKKSLSCIQELNKFILDKVKSTSKTEIYNNLKTILNNEKEQVGFLINERFINIPAQISLPMLENLYKEIKKANQKGMEYDFKYIMMIIKINRNFESGKNEIFFSNQEEEEICKTALLECEYGVENEADVCMSGDWSEDDKLMKPFRRIILFEASKLPELILSIREFINDD